MCGYGYNDKNRKHVLLFDSLGNRSILWQQFGLNRSALLFQDKFQTICEI